MRTPSMYCPSSACVLSLRAEKNNPSCNPHMRTCALAHPAHSSTAAAFAAAFAAAANLTMIFFSFDELFGVTAVVQASAIAAAHLHTEGWGSLVAQERQRKSVHDVHQWMGPQLFLLAYCMSYETFWRLYHILMQHIKAATEGIRQYVPKGGGGGRNYSLPPIPYGPIASSV
jgi:hypothetical protein